MVYRLSRGSNVIAATITPITKLIATTPASTTTAIRLGPKGYHRLLHARLKPPDNH